MTRTPAILAASLAAALAGSPCRATAAPACPPVDDSDLQRGDLPHLAARLKPGGTLNILALGSAPMPGTSAGTSPGTPAGTPPGTPPGTSAGTPAGMPADMLRNAPSGTHAGAAGSPMPHAALPHEPSPSGFPWQLVQSLQTTIHGLKINVSSIPTHGQSAEAMLARLRTELARFPAQLVLWQTGTVDAVDMVSPEDFYQALSDGASATADAGADLVLIDPQYSRFLESNANMAPYLAALQEAATLPGVAVFNRFDIMHDWVESGALDLENAPKADRPPLAARLHACLGRALTRMLIGSAAIR